MNKFWKSNAHCSDYGQQYCILYLKTAERLDFKCSNYKNEITMCYNRGVS